MKPRNTEKERLTEAIAYAERLLEMYQAIPEGFFGATFITSELSEAKDILKNISTTKKALIERSIKKLNEFN